jgi:hypothetical protein
VTLGIPRLREILMTASSRIKTPVMSLPLLPDALASGAAALAVRLRRIRLAEALAGEAFSVDPALRPVLPDTWHAMCRGPPLCLPPLPPCSLAPVLCLRLLSAACALSQGELPCLPPPFPTFITFLLPPPGLSVEENVVTRSGASGRSLGRTYTVRLRFHPPEAYPEASGGST